MTEAPALVSIASSADEELAPHSAPLDAALDTAQVQAIVWRALDLDSSDRALRHIVRPADWVVLKPNLVTSPTHKCSYWHDGVAHPGQVTDARVIRQFKSRFPQDESASDVELWHAFETDHPDTFVGMYQFWVRKKA